MNTDELIEVVVPVVGGYKDTVDTLMDGLDTILDNMNGDTLLVDAERIANEINGEDI